MKVSRTGGTPRVSGTRRAERKQDSDDFAGHLGGGDDTAVGESGGAVASNPSSSVDAILSLQEVPDATDERSRRSTRSHGEDLLERLDALRGWILAGTVPKDKLVELAQRLRAQRRRSDDPRLNEIIDEIELRAEVEIAKLTR